MKKIGEIIRLARISKGMTQEELADIIGYKSRSTIGKIETGEREPSKSVIPKFVEVLDIPLMEVLSCFDWNEEHQLYQQLVSVIDEKKGSQSETLEALNKIGVLLSEEQQQNVVNYAKFLLKNASNT